MNVENYQSKAEIIHHTTNYFFHMRKTEKCDYSIVPRFTNVNILYGVQVCM